MDTVLLEKAVEIMADEYRNNEKLLLNLTGSLL
jgi:hypothetical protein